MAEYNLKNLIRCEGIDLNEIKITEDKGQTIYECPQKSTQKGTTCDSCVCVRMSNYEIAKRRTQKGFCNYNHEAITEKLGLSMDEEYIYAVYFGRDYRVNRKTGSVYYEEEGNLIEADFDDVMTLYDLLCYSKPGAFPAGDYILLHQLSKVENATSYAGSGMWGKQEKALSGKLEKLAEVCEKLNGEPYGKGDVSYRFEVFEGMKVIFSYWDADEDFPPQIQFLCDKNALDYMHFETCWYMVSGLLTRIMSEF